MDSLQEMKLMKKYGNELNSSRNVDKGSLPPCKHSLIQHERRVNYQLGIWRRALVPKPDILDPVEGNGWQIVNGAIGPVWFEGDVMPIVLADILQDHLEKEDDNVSDESDKSVDEFDSDSDSGDDM